MYTNWMDVSLDCAPVDTRPSRSITMRQKTFIRHSTCTAGYHLVCEARAEPETHKHTSKQHSTTQHNR